MSNEAKAIRLAAAMDAVNTNNADSMLVQNAAKAAANELRRQHEVINDLVRALSWYSDKSKMMGKAALHSDSKSMLTLMHEIATDYGKKGGAAIKKATGE